MAERKRRRSDRIPKHRKHATGQGIVTLGGKDFYTGLWGTPKSEERYRALISEWIANDRKAPLAAKTASATERGISVAELCTRFINWARATFPPDEERSRASFVAYEISARLLSERYGLIPAKDFSQKHFHELRDDLIQKRYARNTINHRMSRVKRIFAWGEEREHVPYEVCAKLNRIKNLAKGELGVRERPKVAPVADDVVQATLPYLNPTLQALVKVLRHTGARVGEMLRLRPMDLDRSAETWLYRPSSHKTESHQERVIRIGPKAQETLQPMLEGLAPAEYVFRGVRKKKPLNPMDVATTVKRAAERAKQPHWHPHQLRHSFGTQVRREHGLEAAQVLLGHSDAAMSERYAEPDVGRALEAVKKIG
jgi:integrase